MTRLLHIAKVLAKLLLQLVILYMGNDIFTTQNETTQKKINETKTKSLTEILEKRVKYVQN